MNLIERWRLRRQWLNSPAFDEAVARECVWLRHLHGDKALDAARRKLARPSQRTSRKLVWRAVVRHLEAETSEGLTSQ